ncbi:MAG: hypothetical protein KGJ80_14480 [Chloroflexota bacterium]|nr:hypothetical protein [Chloroflexota bacterium]
MEAKLLQTRARKNLELFYQQRAERLKPLKLEDVLSKTSRSLWSAEGKSAPEVVQRLIEEYLGSFEKWWNALIEDADLCLAAINVRQQITTPRYAYEEELANAQNRITLAFVKRYCTLDYGIDWEKLFRFNSGAD